MRFSIILSRVAAWLICFFVATVPALSADVTVEIGDITITYNDTRLYLWPGFAPPEDGMERLIFVPVEERAGRFPGSAVAVVARPDTGEITGPDPFLVEDPLYDGRPLWQGYSGTPNNVIAPFRDFGGLMLQGWVFHSRCRNWTPPLLMADGVHNGTRYSFSAGLPNGCRGGGYGNEETFNRVLNGIALKPD